MLKWINKKRNKKGFTLVELVVVIAILGILAALAVPRLSGSRDKANQSAVKANLRTIESALMLYETEEGVVYSGSVDGLEDYLAVVPKGPSGVTYDVNDEGRATAKFPKVDMFGLKNTKDQEMTLENFIEETDSENP